ncbi:glutamate-5-semialdehyde dehydrogenase [Cellulophaga sp. F20128]|uniref:glutamate-5-semialdehyde dehydrogenase n=1 Tax=Cellulophaga sp. F20128 TaxID=2926413 RepID=UPI001FF1E555|nr:glutamate-5-semialdehyde dehydrogenase [Cellulophaga sp. F20128]MCK0158668.1 glutamate-5-semialdehyde dehydrogenase [Cellulophaga sp. F20128]
MKLLTSKLKNKVLDSMLKIIEEHRVEILEENKKDIAAFTKDDQALLDRLIVNNNKIDGMLQAITEVKDQEDPVGREISNITLESGLVVTNKTAPFGTILIIYESRPDVTIEAAVLAFKANNKILLKGGKEALHTNIILEKCWHQALEENNVAKDWIKLLHLQREETQEFLKHPPEKLDLIVPRGGERLIQFVKENASCAVLVSGRGNNFLYVAEDADWEKAIAIIINAKTDKISGCNALDKVLVNKHIPDYEAKIKELQLVLQQLKVTVITDEPISKFLLNTETITDNNIWKEEFLALKILIGEVDDLDSAIQKINTHSGGHSAVIVTQDPTKATTFMEQIDSAAVYHNASTRFTDGGQMGVGAELAISTDKLHHRGPLGLKQLVTNKYYVYGDGHIRK